MRGSISAMISLRGSYIPIDIGPGKRSYISSDMRPGDPISLEM